MPDRHPAMLYRPGTETLVWGHRCDTVVVADEAEEAAAAAEGFSRQPPPEDGDYPETGRDAPASLAILDNSVKTIIEALPELSLEELQAVLEAETNGKIRKGLITALSLAIAAATPAAEVEAADETDQPNAADAAQEA